MQIAAPIASPLSGLTAVADAQHGSGRPHTAGHRQGHPPASPAADAPRGEEVSFSPSAEEIAATPEAGQFSHGAAMVFAEIWKDGQKLAQVDTHGRVISLSGLVPPLEGGTLAGPLLAAQRAVQVAQQVGGEIRAAGQAIERDTLLMRARLARTYGAAL